MSLKYEPTLDHALLYAFEAHELVYLQHIFVNWLFLNSELYQFSTMLMPLAFLAKAVGLVSSIYGTS